ncbi:sulfite reductase flavoprotein subunit alpha [Gallaecimonas sp. GXIMD4217]|uniref:sulfite reductase flavoprotein subunit alpha n=1 Tax=Gallaecimonas sp. GXIMD4217 TaxID=3131927 RepID=UPI00311AD1B3
MQRISFRLHQCLGLCSALVLFIVGLTGALLSFEEEILSAFGRGGHSLEVREQVLPAPELSARLSAWARDHDQQLARLYLYPDEPQRPGQALLKGEGSFGFKVFDPYTGEVLGDRPLAADVLTVVMFVHRWLLLPRSVGGTITGIASFMALFLIITGLIRRAPDRLGNVRQWLGWRRGLRGRQALWQWHAVIGTWLVLPLLIMAITGPWFSFDWYRSGLKAMLASPAAEQAELVSSGREVDQHKVWASFLKAKPDGEYALWMLPKKPGAPLTVRYLEDDAPHHHAYSKLSFDAATGVLLQHEKFSDLKGGDYLLANIYGLHTGQYFGLAGKLIWLLASLAVCSFAVTGLWLFLKRRRRPRAETNGEAQTLVAYASQSGTAAHWGQRAHQWLAGQGVNSHLRSMTELAPAQLGQYRQVLLLASTYGEGEPPDAVRGFAQQLAEAELSLGDTRVAVLAFGDSQYQAFCAFGHWLAERAQQLGAALLLPVQEVDRGAEGAIRHWFQGLSARLGLDGELAEAPWQQALVVGNHCLNPGQPLRTAHHLRLALPGARRRYRAGDLLEVLPVRHPSQLQPELAAVGLDPHAQVRLAGRRLTLAEALAGHLEWQGETAASPQQLVDRLPPLAPRSYSLASSPLAKGDELHLLVRRLVKDDGRTGLASGQLAAIKPGQQLQVRLKTHAGFHGPDSDRPLVMIGAGTGLAPYIGFLAERASRANPGPAWLLMGERHPDQDAYFDAELRQWQANGVLSRLDRAWSRGEQPAHVQDLVVANLAELKAWLDDGAVLHVCGSATTLGPAVHQVLVEGLGQQRLDELQDQGRYKRDLY